MSVNLENSTRRCSIMFVKKYLGLGGGHVPPVPPLDPPLHKVYIELLCVP